MEPYQVLSLHVLSISEHKGLTRFMRVLVQSIYNVQSHVLLTENPNNCNVLSVLMAVAFFLRGGCMFGQVCVREGGGSGMRINEYWYICEFIISKQLSICR